MLTVYVRHESGDEEPVEVDQAITAGRDPSCGLFLPDPSVSRLHALVRPTSRGATVEDLDSKGGTFLNHRRVSGPSELLEGDIIQIGKTYLRIHFGKADSIELTPAKEEGSETRAPSTRLLTVGTESFRVSRQYLTQLLSREELGASPVSEQLDALLVLSTRAASLLDRPTLFREVANHLLGFFHEADRVVILESESENDPSDLKTKLVLHGPHARKADTLRLNREVLISAIRKREAILHISDAKPDAVSATRSIICAPLWHGRRILGALYLDGASPFSETSLRFLTAMAGIVATSLQNVLLFERVQTEAAQRANLARYFSKDLVERILKNEIPFAREGRLHRATILMVDLCGFTRMTTETEPARLIASLNAYFGAMQRNIFQNHGTVERFGGDSILAYWGVVETDRFAAWRACFAAIAMQNEMLPLNNQLKKNDYPPLEIAMGVNTGDVVAGDVGSEERYEFTVLGDAVNMARRLQDLASAGEIYIGQETARSVGRSALVKPLPPRIVKGRTTPLQFSMLYGVRSAGEESGVQYNLSIPATVTTKELQSAGRAIRISFRREQDGGRYHARLILNLLDDLSEESVEFQLTIGDHVIKMEAELLGDDLSADATTYWSDALFRTLKDGPFETALNPADPEALLRALGIIS